MSDVQHTPEPWKAGHGRLDGGYLGIFQQDTDFVVARISPESKMDGQDQANARRIVVCVNACRGMKLEWLKARPLSERFTEKATVIHDALRERDEARAMVAELMAMVKKDEWTGYSDELGPHHCHECGRADPAQFPMSPGHAENCSVGATLTKAALHV